MALWLIHASEVCRELRPGDVVFSYAKEARYPLHVAIFVGETTCEIMGICCYAQVDGVPHGPRASPPNLGTAIWGKPDQYRIDIVGQRLDVDPIKVQEVAILSQAHIRENSRLGRPCEWNHRKRKLDGTFKIDGIDILVQANCAHYVEWLYEAVNIDIVGPGVRVPDRPADFIYPATQVHAFWRGTYPLDIAWDDRLRQYPGCIQLPNCPRCTTA